MPITCFSGIISYISIFHIPMPSAWECCTQWSDTASYVNSITCWQKQITVWEKPQNNKKINRPEHGLFLFKVKLYKHRPIVQACWFVYGFHVTFTSFWKPQIYWKMWILDLNRISASQFYLPSSTFWPLPTASSHPYTLLWINMVWKLNWTTFHNQI